MILSVVQLATMPDISEYVTIEQAADDERVPYTTHWLRVLCQKGKIKAEKFGSELKGQWLVHLPSLLEYIKEMEDLGTKKHGHRD